MVVEIDLSEDEYGSGFSQQACNEREQNPISPQRNIATFHLVPRPDLTGTKAPGNPYTITRASTGIGVYEVVSGRRIETEVKINISHSESQIIYQDLKEKIGADGQFPKGYVIDWIYTERPACPDPYLSGRKIHDGCLTEITKLERLQSERRWDVGTNPDMNPYAYRNDLGIKVYSSFTSSTAISTATNLAPVRHEIKHQLFRKLIDLYQKSYDAADAGSEEYDHSYRDEQLPRDTWNLVETTLPRWTSQDTGVTSEVFHQLLQSAADALLRQERNK
ncbi:hypothetical protein [Parafrankia sp. FMc2]|uniref:hypothetical protein n=1 Tax=Parafrankia sp. FMc2 TaxID=3233196 RepID=UPI0034D49591